VFVDLSGGNLRLHVGWLSSCFLKLHVARVFSELRLSDLRFVRWLFMSVFVLHALLTMVLML
jgi:hypothetical protein